MSPSASEVRPTAAFGSPHSVATRGGEASRKERRRGPARRAAPLPYTYTRAYTLVCGVRTSARLLLERCRKVLARAARRDRTTEERDCAETTSGALAEIAVVDGREIVPSRRAGFRTQAALHGLVDTEMTEMKPLQKKIK